MHISFIAFIVAAVVIIAVAACLIVYIVRKAAKQESPEAQNNIPYEDCLAKNASLPCKICEAALQNLQVWYTNI